MNAFTWKKTQIPLEQKQQHKKKWNKCVWSTGSRWKEGKNRKEDKWMVRFINEAHSFSR